MSLKKGLMIFGIVLALLPFLLLAFPLWSLYVDHNSYGAAASIGEAISSYAVSSKVIFFITLSIEALASIFGIIFLVRGLFANLDDGDKVDKAYVFGFALPALGHAFFGVTCYAFHAYIPMAVEIGCIALGIISIVFHFKRLSSV